MTGPRDALVIGGGPAGAAAAAHLARAGRDVLLIEREPGPHDKVCGEFVSVEARAHLAALGLDAAALGAVPIDRVRLIRGRSAAEAALPFEALSLSRRALDEALLARAGRAGATILRGRRAVRAARRDGIWEVEADGGGRHAARALILATGKRDLRGFSRPAGVQNDLIGFKTHWRPADARRSRGRVDLFLFDGGYGGLELVEGGALNLCLLIRQRRFHALGRRWDSVIEAVRRECPAVAAALDGAVPCRARPLAAAAIPYGYVARDAGPEALYRVGDQFAVIPSFAGDGIAIALHTAALAAAAVLAGEGADAYARKARRGLAGPVRLATLLSLAAVRPAGQAAAMRACMAAPALLPAVARRTRLRGVAREADIHLEFAISDGK